jgi:LPXTG-motif cell wall-anchored protein
MKATIQVLAATPTGLPNTGGAPIGILGMLGVGLIGAGTVLYRRAVAPTE